MTDVSLPFPPTTNKLWRPMLNKRGQLTMALSKKYKAWKKDTLWVVKLQKAVPIKGRFTAEIILDETRRRSNMDCDNRIKPCLDILQSAGLIENDSLCDDASVTWGKVEGCLVRLCATVPPSTQAAE